MGLRTRVASALCLVGSRLNRLGIALGEDGHVTESDDEDDMAPCPPVALNAKARRMVLDGLSAQRKVVDVSDPEVLTGSIEERMRLARGG